MYQKGLCKLYGNRGEPSVVVPTAPNHGGIISCRRWEATGEDLSSWGRYLVGWKGHWRLRPCFESWLCTWANCFISVSLCSYIMYVAHCTVPRGAVVWEGARGKEEERKSTIVSISILAPTGAQHWKYGCGQSLPQGTWSWMRTPDMGIIRSLDY